MKNFFTAIAAISSMNSICRNSTYYSVSRILVPDDKVSWDVPWAQYAPEHYTADHLKCSSWADLDINDKNFKPKWNAVDGSIDRRSYDNNQPFQYKIVDNVPLNPRGRTGLRGRGVLGRWGPNHAADAVVTRWKRTENEQTVLNPETGLPILQFLAIMRRDCKKWAIPGGFVNANEKSSTAMLRELFEEAIKADSLSCNLTLQKLFSEGKQIYKGYVDDPRNTDNAWIETTASNFHDETGENSKNFVLEARDDAMDVKWVDIVKDMDIYKTHFDIIKLINEFHMSSCKKLS